MSNFCNTELCASVESKATGITSADTANDLLLTSWLIDKSTSDRISYPNYAALPDANTFPNGHLAYLGDAKVPVIASNGTWIGLDGRTVGTFVENQLFSWGYNGCGALGIGTTATQCSPVREICSATDWCDVSTGCRRAHAIKTDGSLWEWGSSPLGYGGVNTVCSPVREYCSATDWCQVSGSYCHTTAIKTTGQLWVWGYGAYGRFGDGTSNQYAYSPVREFCSDTNWCQVSAGCIHTAAVKTSGELWAWGYNNDGRVGDGTTATRCSPVREICSATDWCQVRLNASASFAIKTDGSLWAWGEGNYGQLANGITANICSPVREFCSATNWCELNIGSSQIGNQAIKSDGSLWAWGYNSYGQLGDGTTLEKCSPVREYCSATDWRQLASGDYHRLAIKTSGQLWGWGRNISYGMIGDGTQTDRCSPVREFCSATDWNKVSAHNCNSSAIRNVIIICR